MLTQVTKNKSDEKHTSEKTVKAYLLNFLVELDNFVISILKRNQGNFSET